MVIDMKNEYEYHTEISYKRTYSGTTLLSFEKENGNTIIRQIRVINGIPYIEKLINDVRVSLDELVICKKYYESI